MAEVSRTKKAWRSFLMPLTGNQRSSDSKTSLTPSPSEEKDEMEVALGELRRAETVEAGGLARHFRHLESFTEAVDFETRERWVERLEALGFVPILKSLWPLFWKTDFLSDGGKGDSEFLSTRINFVYCLKILWYGSQVSGELAASLVQAKFIPILLQNLKEEDGLQPGFVKRNPFALFVVTGLVHTISNCLSNADGTKDFIQNHGVHIFSQLLPVSDPALKSGLLISLLLVLNTEENSDVRAESLDLAFMTEQLSHHLEAEPRLLEDECYLALILQSLGAVSVHDHFKKKIVKNGFLSLCTSLLREFRETETPLDGRIVSLALRLLWQLAFLLENREKFRKKKSLLAIIEKLGKHQNSSIHQPASAILVLMRETKGTGGLARSKSSPGVREGGNGQGAREPSAHPNARLKSARFSPKLTNHVFISFSPGSRSRASQLKALLESEGTPVYMELNGTQSMVKTREALESGRAVVVLVSREYRDSPRCRMEAERAEEMGKQMVFLLASNNFPKPDGWLQDFIGDEEIIKEKIAIQGRSEAELTLALPNVLEALGPGEDDCLPDISHGSVPKSKCSPKSCSDWTLKDTKRWIKTLKLSSEAVELFEGFKGKDLISLRKMYVKAPNAYYRTVFDQEDISILDLVRFTEALEGLKV